MVCNNSFGVVYATISNKSERRATGFPVVSCVCFAVYVGSICISCSFHQSRWFGSIICFRPEISRDYPLNLSILLSEEKKTTMIPLVTASEAGRAQSENRAALILF